MTGNIDNSRNQKIHILITLAVMVFIFIQSALPGELSGAESSIVVRFIYWLGSAAGLSGLTDMDADTIHIIVRKLAHFLEYMLLGGCLVVNTHDWYEEKWEHDVTDGLWRPVHISWIIGVIYASTDEIHQFFVPDRACSLRDVCIDSAGVAVGAILVHLVWLRRNRRDNSRDPGGQSNAVV